MQFHTINDKDVDEPEWEKVDETERMYKFDSLDSNKILSMYPVKNNFIRIVPLWDMGNWIVDNTTGNFAYNKHIGMHIWYFDNELDAIMFKLKWS